MHFGKTISQSKYSTETVRYKRLKKLINECLESSTVNNTFNDGIYVKIVQILTEDYQRVYENLNLSRLSGIIGNIQIQHFLHGVGHFDSDLYLKVNSTSHDEATTDDSYVSNIDYIKKSQFELKHMYIGLQVEFKHFADLLEISIIAFRKICKKINKKILPIANSNISSIVFEVDRLVTSFVKTVCDACLKLLKLSDLLDYSQFIREHEMLCSFAICSN